ncbi:helix-turn-helix domain-containing protein (plasmid) [Deinococcus metallilatus]|uniref:HTH-type transcriptional regulator/antitoxin HigA n=1 Tax=Deinococcus metallilatus TaxID=1211322 RepID=A0AAJ5JZF7_9DEIO|nr:helix-turn-helix domain-containing protein [Deinococcus metallilatus]MBB5293207.1 HTH-type transcriptional regulator/antitoxin HigA [Deinococcus metallilatus]QBY06998.1 helix-turn-helix domain-containing protein [Deinococcus metallilatus]RXJ18009.1 helix-turn-helix domain-containing protein [Deinococcus metallilatus]TLK31945.1 helix-turn-helix domain-containing protein [Deinococcus metallilatus]GMA15569.1 hypothetical protein GCM10025871_19000 [Deinococcus metallilatus]
MSLNIKNFERAVAALTELPEAALDLLRPITTEEAYDQALEMVDRLSRIVAGDPHHPLGPVYATLIEHIAHYEEEVYPAEPVPPHVMLDFLMDQNGVRQSDLAEKLGVDQSNVSRLINGKKTFTADLIKQLSQIFKVPATVFLA